MPPPWRLNGSAYAIIYRFSETFVYERVVLPEALRGCFIGGLGALLFVDYADSPVGPYRELAFIPGRFAVDGRKGYAVTHIYVSTQASVNSGRANWGLPKEQADFTVEQTGDVVHWRVAQGGQRLVDARFRPGRLALPLPSWLYRPRLLQPWEGEWYHTAFRAGGRAGLADAEAPKVGAPLPDINRARPVGVVHLRRFDMRFQNPRRWPIG